MKPSKALRAIPALAILAASLACMGGLPASLKRDISWEHDKLQNAARQIDRAAQSVQSDVSSDRDLFANTPVPAQWNAQLQTARNTLESAENSDRQLAELVRRNRADSRDQAERLLETERTLRDMAVDQSQAVEAAAVKWISFRQDLPANLAKMQSEYDAVRAIDLSPVAATVQQATIDWPAKKDALDSRLTTLRQIPQDAQQQWDSCAAARQDASNGKVTGPEIATLIQADDALSQDASRLQSQSGELRNLCGQLYNSWDKVLTDLDVSRDGRDRMYRERIKTIRTHITNVSTHSTETSSDEAWVTVPESSFDTVENDLGMAIAHKDPGVFDSEAVNTPQPAGFAYIAPESQGSNQYGYWTHSGGETFWTFLPQYLILRELLWNHDYRPVLLEDYRGYRIAQRAGHTWYGQATPASPPKYGSHGTFTQSHYASSRYVQSGGFRGSAYGSRNSPSSSGLSAFRGEDHRAAPYENGAGRRFGSAAGSPSGRRFGQAPRAGRAFGRRR